MAVLTGDVLVVNAGSTSLKLYAVEVDAKSTRVESFADVPAGSIGCGIPGIISDSGGAA